MTHSEERKRNNHERNGHEDTSNPKHSWYNPLRIIRWHNGLDNIDRFTFWIAILTFFLVVMTGVQVLSYIESERAFLSIEEIGFIHGEPSVEPDGITIKMGIKNFGKHVAVITQMNAEPSFYIGKKGLDASPDYDDRNIIKWVTSPIPPQIQRTVIFGPATENTPVPKEEIISGTKNGKIPFHVFGFIDYDTGYRLSSGRVGFCFTYIPESQRRVARQSFKACDNPNYTYTH